MDYAIRASSKARRPRLEVSPFGHVSVVIPLRFDPNRIPAFVAQHAPWLERVLQRIAAQRSADPQRFDARPAHIELRAINETWRVAYEAHASGLEQRQLALFETPTIHLSGPAARVPQPALRAWLQKQATHHLVPWLERKSAATGLPFAGARVRGQKTRWGSCTSRKVISLNRALLFLPPALADYLLLHELCHTVHLNHSRRYWAVVGSYEPAYREFERRLHGALQYVPRWAVES